MTEGSARELVPAGPYRVRPWVVIGYGPWAAIG